MQIDASVTAHEGRVPVRADAQWAFLACGPAGFAVPLDRVSEVVTPQPLTRVPGCGPEVCGLLGFRGRVVTVFDLGVLAGVRPSMSAADYRMVLLDHGGRLLGLAAETMLTVAAAPPAPALPGAETGLIQAGDITGTVTVDGRTFATLDVDHLLGRLLA